MLRAFVLSSLAVAASLASAAPDRGVFDSAGRLIALVHDGARLDVQGQLLVSFEGVPDVVLQPHDQRSPITREGLALRWQGSAAFANSGSARFTVDWEQQDEGRLAVDAMVVPANQGWGGAGAPLDVQAVDYVLDLPATLFAGGQFELGAAPVPAHRPADPTFFRGETAALRFVDAAKNWSLALTLDQPRLVTLTDRWDAQGRSLRVRIRVAAGLLPSGAEQRIKLTLQVAGRATAAPVRLAVDPAAPRYRFDGFGGNYCWGGEPAIADYLLKNLRHVWSRHEFKALLWDRERHEPGPELRRDFEFIQRVHRQGLPWIISGWRLPERFFVDPNQRAAGTFGRHVAADRWPELLELIGSYLLHLKTEYGAEADLFSFNEPDLGVSVGFTAEMHRDAIKRIGAHLESLGLKTKMLLGDTANPRDTHRYVLPTAADPEAMRYVRAVSFHSWGDATPAQWQAWGDLADWLQLPLLVGEAGVDPGAWRNRNYDSFDYGLREARQLQDMLRHARIRSSLYWQYTSDYAIVRVGADGAVQPTGRYWLMKQFTDLTPLQSQVVVSSSDRDDVHVSAFVKDGALAVHVLNLGAARPATLTGLPAGAWRTVTTTETDGYRDAALPAAAVATSGTTLELPARSLTTLVRAE